MKASDQRRLKDLRVKVRDLRNCHGEAIDQNHFLRLHAGLIGDMEWLIGLADKAAVPEPDLEDATV